MLLREFFILKLDFLKIRWSSAKISQRKAGASYQTLIKIEQGRIKNPKPDTLIKLAKV